MPDMGDIDFSRRRLERSASRLRLDTLVRLRWLALAGQAWPSPWWPGGFEFPMKTEACLAVIAVSVALNLVLRFRFPVSQRLSDDAADRCWPSTSCSSRRCST